MRECALTRQEKPVAELLRFVVGPDGDLLPDIDARAPGRGVWVTADRASISEAVRRKAFSRSLREKVDVPETLAEMTLERLEQRLAGALGLARKAGQIVTGATKVRAAIDGGEVIALFTASDAAPDGRGKMLGALRARFGDAPVPHFEILSSDQLGLALGLENVIHAALTKGAAAQSALRRAEKLARFIA
ncbi:MAG TPA: RNA-binding protein [Devosiaceae bacterium]